MPATCGLAMLVPLMDRYCRPDSHPTTEPLQAAVIWLWMALMKPRPPGAYTSTSGPKLE
jgi:hypothetical protein